MAKDLENVVQSYYLTSMYERKFNFQLIALQERWLI